MIEKEKLKVSHSEQINQIQEKEIRQLQETVKHLREQNQRQSEQLKTALETVNTTVNKQLPEPKKPLLEQIAGFLSKK